MPSDKQSKVRISLWANRLIKGSDPYAVVTLLSGNSKDAVLGRTEVIKNDLNPSWTTTFTTDFEFGKETKFDVEIFYEIQNNNTTSSKSLGSAQFEIGDILWKGGKQGRGLKNGGGAVFVWVAMASDFNQGDLDLGLKGVKLKNASGLFSKSDPFFQVDAHIASGVGGRIWSPVYRSETATKNLDPTWNDCKIAIDKLCGGNKEKLIRIQVLDGKKSGKHQPMGSFETSTNALLAAGPNAQFELKRRGKKHGKVMVTKAEVSGIQMDPNRPPPKFSTVNGIRRINPDYKKWQEATQGQSQTPP